MDEFIIAKQNNDNPKILTFRIENINVAIINAIRRTLLMNIEVIVLDTSDDNCIIEKNTTRLTNEIIKQRLNCVPLHINDMNFPYKQYTIVIKKTNKSNHLEFITSNDISIVSNLNGKAIEKHELEKIFPKCDKTNMYIDLIRLRPKLSDSLGGEEFDLNCKLKKSTASENSSYNVVTKVAFSNTIDINKSKEGWEEYKKTIIDKDTMDAEKENWNIFNSQRFYIPNSFDFIVETVGIYKPKDLIHLACNSLMKTLSELSHNITNELVEIKENNEHIQNGYDIYLTKNDITIGHLLQYILLDKYLNKKISYVGYTKGHPHDPHSILRIQLINKDASLVPMILIEGINTLKEIFSRFKTNF